MNQVNDTGPPRSGTNMVARVQEMAAQVQAVMHKNSILSRTIAELQQRLSLYQSLGEINQASGKEGSAILNITDLRKKCNDMVTVYDLREENKKLNETMAKQATSRVSAKAKAKQCQKDLTECEQGAGLYEQCRNDLTNCEAGAASLENIFSHVRPGKEGKLTYEVWVSNDVKKTGEAKPRVP